MLPELASHSSEQKAGEMSALDELLLLSGSITTACFKMTCGRKMLLDVFTYFLKKGGVGGMTEKYLMSLFYRKVSYHFKSVHFSSSIH